MTSDGSAYTRFKRALEVGNLTLVRAAAELLHVSIRDALRVCLLLRDDDDLALYERAAVQWTGRFALQTRGADLKAIQTAAAALEALPAAPAEAMETLAALCAAYQVT